MKRFRFEKLSSTIEFTHSEAVLIGKIASKSLRILLLFYSFRDLKKQMKIEL